MGKKNSSWENEIEDMIEKVEKSIRSIDFDRLGKKIDYTVNRTMDQAMREVKKVWNRKSDIGQKMNNFENQVEHKMRQGRDEWRRRTDQRKFRNHTYSTRVHSSPNTRRVSPKKERTSYPKVQKVSFPVASVPYGSVSGVFYKIFGGIGTVGFALCFFTCFLYLITGYVAVQLGEILLFFFLTIAASLILYRGITQRRRVRRFRDYVKIMNGKNHYPIEKLAAYTGRKKEFVIKDLTKMVKKRMFLEGHLDQTKTDFILDHQTYELYLNSLISKKEREEERKAQERQEEIAAAKENQSEEDKMERVFCEGEIYIKKIREANDKIAGEEMSRKLFHLENVTHKIFEHIKKYPNKIDKIEKFMEYYLPTTLKLVTTYQELNAQPVEGENIAQIKRDIENTLDTINTAFEKLLDDLFEEEMFDISSDISVLETVLKQEGLAESDFNLKDAKYEKVQ